MNQGNSNSDNNMTVKEAAIHFDETIDVIKKRLTRKYKWEKEPSTKYILTDIEWAYLIDFDNKKKKEKGFKNQPIIKNSSQRSIKKKTLKSFSLSTMTELDIINFIEMGLIIFGLYQIFYIPGIMLSLMVCLYIFKAQSIAKNSKFRKTITKSLEVVYWIATASFFLHFVTFYRNIPEFELVTNSTNGFITIGVPLLIAFLPALFTSILNYMSISTTASISKKE